MIESKPIYRMSHAGACPRALSAERLGYTPTEAPVWLETAANEGKMHEQWIVDGLSSDGYMVTGQQTEVTLDYPKFVLIGHIDGIAFRDEKTYLLEIKTMSHFEFQRWMKGEFSEYPTYADQISLYYQALKKDMELAGILYVVKNRSSGYTWGNILPTPPSDFELVISKLIAVERAVANKELYEADFDPSSTECKRCGYRDQICLVSKQQLTPAIESTLLEATKQVQEGKTLMEQGQKLYNKGRDTLSNHCEAISPDKKFSFNFNDVHTVRFFTEPTSFTVNKKGGWQVRCTDLRKVEEDGE